ncbi:MAG: HAD family phosphatase [Eubacterium sp.]|nr:HAD family phosphatase [Eubacterium sp.]
MKCKGAIFDMDGLLFDTERVYQQTWRELADEQGIELGSDFTRMISGTNGAHMRHVVESYYHVADGTVVIEECMRRVKAKLSRQVPMKKGVPEILQFFRENGIRMAVASSSATEQILSNVELADIREYFSEIVSGTEVKRGKPAPDIFLLAAEKIDCKPSECFVFEDSENGIKAGYAAGCCTVMIPDLMEPTQEIRPYCTMICTDLMQAEKQIWETFFRDIFSVKN